MAESKIRKTSGNPTIVYDSTDSSTNIRTQVVANGTCVTVSSFRNDGGQTKSGWTEIATIPSGYEPNIWLYGYFAGSDNNILRYRIRSASVEVYSPQAGVQLGCCLSYPI